MATAQVLDAAASETATPSAVVWINGRHAFMALSSQDGRISTSEITRAWSTETAYMAHVVGVIGDRERVVILGPSSARLELEREYVAMFHRPDRLVDVERADALSPEEIIDRLRTLAA